MNYSQALEARAEVVKFFQKHGDHLLSEQGTPSPLLGLIAHSLDHAESYYWSPDICAIVEHTASDVPPSARLAPDDFPSTEGFFLFSRPCVVDIRDNSGNGLQIDTEADRRYDGIAALNWGRVSRESGEIGLGLCAYARADCGCLVPVQMTSVWPPATIDEYLTDLLRENPSPPESDAASEHSFSIIRCAQLVMLLYTCLAFVRDRILVAPQHRVQRHVRKRLERDGVTDDIVRVVELRRKASLSSHHGPSVPVAWSHQWIVSGHWRQQWYPKLQTNQPRWVMPYVKGPADKPLKPPVSKVFEVTR